MVAPPPSWYNHRVNPNLLSAFPVVCPVCRKSDDDGLHLHTVEPEGPGHLLCVGCGFAFPLIDGIPLLAKDLGGLVRSNGLALLDGAVSASVAATLALAGDDDDAWQKMLEGLSTWGLSHWGDVAEPRAVFGFREFFDHLTRRAMHPVENAVELGCGFGRGLAALSLGAERVVGVDISVAALKRARRLLAGEAQELPVRVAGRHYDVARLSPQDRCENVLLLAADALDPPLPPGIFERVVSLNLLDTIPRPRALLGVMDGLCAPGGELIVASPFCWQTGIVDEGERIGDRDPADALMGLLESGTGLSGPYTIEESFDLHWTLRRDARQDLGYSVHWIRARKV